MSIGTHERWTYLALVAGFLVLIAGLTWEGSGQELFNPGDYFWEIPGNFAPPELHLDLKPTAGGGLAVWLTTKNYNFTNFCSATAPNQTVVQGHAHLYVDGIKLASLYTPYWEIKGLTPGRHEILVWLNVLPEHRVVTVHGRPLMLKQGVRVSDQGIGVLAPEPISPPTGRLKNSG